MRDFVETLYEVEKQVALIILLHELDQVLVLEELSVPLDLFLDDVSVRDIDIEAVRA